MKPIETSFLFGVVDFNGEYIAFEVIDQLVRPNQFDANEKACRSAILARYGANASTVICFLRGTREDVELYAEVIAVYYPGIPFAGFKAALPS